MEYFLQPNFVITTTNVGKSVDQVQITHNIKDAALMWVKPLLGNYFFENLLAAYNAQTLTTDEQDLVLNYIKPCIAWKTAVSVAINTSLSVRNKGIQTQSGDFSNDASMAQFGFLVKDTSQKADFYANEMTKYLIDNKDLFPDLMSPLNKGSRIKEIMCEGSIGNFQSGINFM